MGPAAFWFSEFRAPLSHMGHSLGFVVGWSLGVVGVVGCIRSNHHSNVARLLYRRMIQHVVAFDLCCLATSLAVQPTHCLYFQVAEVKRIIETTQGQSTYPADQQMLIYQGKILKDETTLEGNGVAENSFLVIMLSKVFGALSLVYPIDNVFNIFRFLTVKCNRLFVNCAIFECSMLVALISVSYLIYFHGYVTWMDC